MQHCGDDLLLYRVMGTLRYPLAFTTPADQLHYVPGLTAGATKG